MKKLLALATSIFLFIACKPNLENNPSSGIDGLWIVQNVQVGDDEMTPDSRWIRFHSDSTQESGNGWLQHSYGSWAYNEATKSLRMNDTNGIKDIYPPFSVKLKGDSMQWTREEDGYSVTVNLIQEQDLPQSRADKMLGIWKLKSATQNGADILDSLQPEKQLYLYLAWDKRFTLGNTLDGRKRGVYFIHPHRAQLQLMDHSIYNLNRWNFDVAKNRLKLSAFAKEKEEVVLEFGRGDEF